MSTASGNTIRWALCLLLLGPSFQATSEGAGRAGTCLLTAYQDEASSEEIPEVQGFWESRRRADAVHEEGKQRALARYIDDLKKARPAALKSGDLIEVNLIDEQLEGNDDKILRSAPAFKLRMALKAREALDSGLANLRRAFENDVEKSRERAVAALRKRIRSALLEDDAALANSLQLAVEELEAMYIAPPVPPKRGDLLNGFDAKVNSFRGPWERLRDGSLRTKQTSAEGAAPILAFPVTEETPKEFSVELSFDIDQVGKDASVFLLIPAGGREFAWNLGIRNDNTNVAFEPGNVKWFGARNPYFEAGMTYHFSVRVTETDMTFLEGGNALYSFIHAEVGARDRPDFPDRAVCLRSCNAITIREFRVLPLDR